MKYGERLRAARHHAELSQVQLAEKAGVGTQENVSKLERGDAEGSEFTAQYAAACGVNALWLASGKGEMVDDPLIRRVVEALKHVNADTARYIAVTVEAHAKSNALPVPTTESDTDDEQSNDQPARRPAVRVMPYSQRKFPHKKPASTVRKKDTK